MLSLDSFGLCFGGERVEGNGWHVRKVMERVLL